MTYYNPDERYYYSAFNKVIEFEEVNAIKKKLTMNYYEDPKKAPRKKDVKEKQKIVHGADKFLIWFNTMYQENKYFCNGLLCCLMHIFV